MFTIQKSSIAKIWAIALLFQVVSKWEAISQFGIRRIKGEAQGVANRN